MNGWLPLEYDERLEVCAVDLGCDPTGADVRVIDRMEVPGTEGGALRSARWLRDLRQRQRPSELVFIRKMVTQTVRSAEIVL